MKDVAREVGQQRQHTRTHLSPALPAAGWRQREARVGQEFRGVKVLLSVIRGKQCLPWALFLNQEVQRDATQPATGTSEGL